MSAMGIRYKAMIGVPEYKPAGKVKKADLDAYQWEIAKIALRYWDSTVAVKPYPDMFAPSPDEEYARIMRNTSNLKKAPKTAIGGTDPQSVLNYYGRVKGRIYLPYPPEEYVGTDIREPSEKVGLLTYSAMNPNGMFDGYKFPIETPSNGIDLKTSRLCNNNYGTYSDMLKVGDIAWDATVMPDVCFCMFFDPDGKFPRDDDGMSVVSNPRQSGSTVYEMRETSDPNEIMKFYEDRIGKSGMVALIECLA